MASQVINIYWEASVGICIAVSLLAGFRMKYSQRAQ